MTTYTTRTLAEAIIGEDEVTANPKAATRTLRKFLRDELGEGKAVVGKGGRYALDYNKTQVKAMAKKFAAWEAQQEADKAARAAARDAAKPTPAPIAEVIEDDADDIDAPDSEDAFAEAGPTDEEIAAMLEDDTDEV
jgi:hypothetical protein